MSRDAAAAWSIAAAALLACAAALADDANTIVQNGRAFHPAEITIAHGTTLNFSNQDEFIHQIYVDSARLRLRLGGAAAGRDAATSPFPIRELSRSAATSIPRCC